MWKIPNMYFKCLTWGSSPVSKTNKSENMGIEWVNEWLLQWVFMNFPADYNLDLQWQNWSRLWPENAFKFGSLKKSVKLI